MTEFVGRKKEMKNPKVFIGGFNYLNGRVYFERDSFFVPCREEISVVFNYTLFYEKV